MKTLFGVVIAIVSLMSAPLWAVDLYGRANLSYEYVSDELGDYTELVSNYSKIGLKGEEGIREGITAVYKFEYHIILDDGETFKPFNIYAGIKGSYGTLIGGYFDTPLRRAQNKVDLFNFLRGDIKNMLTVNENRKGNSVMYISPGWKHLTAYLAHIASESPDVDSGMSAAAIFDRGPWYAALAMDESVEEEGAQAVRLVAHYQAETFQLGALYEIYSAPNADQVNAWLVSAKYAVSEHWVAKIQSGLSDIVYKNATSTSLGLDYVFSKTYRTYVFYTAEQVNAELPEDDQDNDYLGLGFEWYF